MINIPTEPVIINFNTTLIFEPNSLTFDSNNWDVPQQITCLNDEVDEGSHEYIISHTVTSNDINFNNFQIEDVTVQVTDNITTEPPKIVNTTGLPNNYNVRDNSNIITTVCNVEQQKNRRDYQICISIN